MKHSYILIALLLVSQLILISCKDRTPIQNAPQTSGEVDEIPAVPQKVKLPMEEELLRKSSLEGDVGTVSELLARNVDVNSLDQDGRTALMFAAFNGHLEIVIALYEAGTKINLQDYNGRSALMFASSGKFPETVRFLLENDAEPNLVDMEEHFTALMFASSEGNIEVVKILLSFNADPKLTDVDGETAELFAQTNGHIEIAELIRIAMGN